MFCVVLAIAVFSIIIRLSEPIVFAAFKNAICRCRCCMKNRNNDDVLEKDSLNSFLNSAMNTDYVILILGGITHFLNNHASSSNLNTIRTSSTKEDHSIDIV